MPRPAVDLLLLDLGGVVLEVDPLEVPRRLGLAEHVREDFLQRVGSARIALDFEAGSIDQNAFYRGVLAAWEPAFGSPPERETFFRAWCSTIRGEIDGVGRLLGAARGAVHLMALSNTDRMHMEDVIRTMPVAALFERIFTSYEFGCRKPDARIYEQTLSVIESTVGIGADRILFVDDREENVHAARQRGMRAELCRRSSERLGAILRHHGIDTAERQAPC